jgi:polysaccharide chain length determinant protein (PEP-CTERM system associated)
MSEVLHYFQNAARFKWSSIILAWIICLGGWAYVSQMPDVFTATTRVHVDTRSILRPLLQGMTIVPDVSSQIHLMTRLIFTRPNIEKIAKMTDLDLTAKDEKSMEKLVLRLQKSMVIEGGENNLFSIGVTDPDPKTAKKVVQAVLTLFVEQSLGETREDSDSARKFLDQQIKEHEQRLLAAEKAHEEFKRENYSILMGGSDLYSQMNQLETQKEQAKLQYQEALRRRDEIQRQLDNEEPTLIKTEAELLAAKHPIDERIINLRTKLDELLLRYTEKHPAIITLKKSLVDLEKQKKVEIKEAVEHPEQSSLTKGRESNPIYQQLKIALGEADANAASLSTREKSYEDKIIRLKQEMDERLKIETKSQGLSRDYDTVKANYNQLIAKRETARMSGSVEQETEAVKFRIVDPPQVPTKPSAPNRILLSSAIFLGSLVFGLGLAVLLSLLRPSFGTIQGLRDVTGLAVLGSISMNWIPEVRQKTRRDLMKFMATLFALLFVYVCVIVLELKDINIRHFLVNSGLSL